MENNRKPIFERGSKARSWTDYANANNDDQQQFTATTTQKRPIPVVPVPDDDGDVPLYQSSKRIKIERGSLGESLFRDEATKDFMIVSGDGEQVKCHKLVLKVRSDWFVKMLENPESKEVKEGRLVLEWMTKWGVNQLVRYLYEMEIPATEVTPEYALELLQNGHAYQVHQLVQNVGNFLLEKDKRWFRNEEDVDVLLELYFFTKKLKAEENVLMRQLNARLLQILSRFSSKTLRKAQRFLELSSEDSTNLLFDMHDILLKNKNNINLF